MNSFFVGRSCCIDKEDVSPCIKFEKISELFELDFFKRMISISYFSHFALYDKYIIAVLDNGFNWRVMGRVEKIEGVDLPQWDGWKFYAKMLDGQTRILTNVEVELACGNNLILRDGTNAEDVTHMYIKHE